VSQPNFTLGQILTSPEMNQLADMVLYPTPTSVSVNPCAAGTSYVVTTGASALTMTLPNSGSAIPALAGNIIGIKKADNTAGTVTVTVAGGTYILGPGVPASTASIQVSAYGAFVTLLFDGTNWHIISGAQDTGWLVLTNYANSWLSSSGPATGGTAAGYRVTGNVVRLGGKITAGTTGLIAFTLPATAYPMRALTLMSADTSTPTIVSWAVSAAGVCTPTYTAGTIPTLDLLAWTTD
jgi:hypothetical protein